MTDELIIRADADSLIGIGHVIRCLALSQAWQDQGGRSTFIVSRLSPALQSMLEAEGIRVHFIDAHPGSSADAATTAELVRKFPDPWLVLDGYHFDTDYQKTLKDSGCRLLCLDDNGHADHYSADIVLNQNLHANERLYANKDSHTRLLLGPRFSLLRRQFRNRPTADRNTAPIASRLLVTMGGGDQKNVTARVIKAIRGIKLENLKVKVVVGQTNPHLDLLTGMIDETDGAFTLLKNVTDMADLMAWADMVVSGGGSTCWETAYMGLPAVVLTTFDNQQHIANQLIERGVVLGLGWHEAVNDNKLRESIWTLSQSAKQRRQMSLNGRHLVDGRGVYRTIRAMSDL